MNENKADLKKTNNEREAQLGTVLKYGGSSHHSGEIEGYRVKVESGRWAVVSKNTSDLFEEQAENEGKVRDKGEDPIEKRVFWGMLKKFDTNPVWTARHGGEWLGDELDPSTELDFQSLVEFFEVDLVMKDVVDVDGTKRDRDHSTY